jgi:hypothetical protein
MYVEGRCGVDLVIDWVVGGSGMEAVTVEAKPQNAPWALFLIIKIDIAIADISGLISIHAAKLRMTGVLSRSAQLTE